MYIHVCVLLTMYVCILYQSLCIYSWLDSSKTLCEQDVKEHDLLYLRYKYFSFMDIDPRVSPLPFTHYPSLSAFHSFFYPFQHLCASLPPSFPASLPLTHCLSLNLLSFLSPCLPFILFFHPSLPLCSWMIFV